MSEDEEQVRLQVVLSRAGLASRRRAETLITDGRVAVNGEVVRELGTRVDPDVDVVTVDGRPLGDAEPKVTVLLHKPAGVLSTRADERGRETVAHLVEDEPYTLKPVGRLDYHSEGVLLLTTDGELANRLLNPKNDIPKTYQVKIGGHPDEGALRKLRDGIELEDGRTRPAIVEVLEADGPYSWLELIVTEGRNRLVRRMCEAVHHRVLRLVRTEFATLGLEELRPGQYRYLTGGELERIYGLAGLPRPEAASGRAEEVGLKRLGVARRRKGALPGETWSGPRDDGAKPKRARAERETDAERRPTRAPRDEGERGEGEGSARPTVGRGEGRVPGARALRGAERPGARAAAARGAEERRPPLRPYDEDGGDEGEDGVTPRRAPEAPARSAARPSTRGERPVRARPTRGAAEGSGAAERPARGRFGAGEERPARGRFGAGEERPARGRFGAGEERPARGRFGAGEERPARGRFGAGEERPARGRFGAGEERPARGRFGAGEERPARGRFGAGEERPARGRFGAREERPARGRFGAGEERPARGRFGAGEERPARGRFGAGEERPARGRAPAGDERPARGRFGAGEERPARGRFGAGDERPARGRFGAGEERPARGRAAAGEARGARGRSGAGEERPARGRAAAGEARGARSRPGDERVGGERPHRGEVRRERPERRGGEERPRRGRGEPGHDDVEPRARPRQGPPRGRQDAGRGPRKGTKRPPRR